MLLYIDATEVKHVPTRMQLDAGRAFPIRPRRGTTSATSHQVDTCSSSTRGLDVHEMAILPRTDRKLLSMVNGKPHATADDHEDPFPTPPTSTGPRSSGPQSTNMTDDEDINRDPESSDDDELPPMQMQKKSGGQTSGFRIPKVVDVSSAQNTAQTSFRKPNAPSHSKKRSSPPEEFSAQDDMIFTSSQSSQPKRKKPDAKPTTGNIHTVRPPPGSIPKFMFYGKNANTTKKKKGALKKAKAMSAEEATKFAIQGTAAAFKSAPGARMEFQNRQPSPNFQNRTSEFTTRCRSSSVSSLSSVPSSPGVEEIQSLNLPIPVPYISKIECDICGSTIPLSLRQDFEDQFNDGKRLNYKWRDRSLPISQGASSSRTVARTWLPEY